MTSHQSIDHKTAQAVSQTPFTAAIPADNEALCDELTRLAGHINAAEYRFLKLLAELVKRNAWDCGTGMKSPAHWLNYQCGIALGAAREKVRVAKALPSVPQIDAAFSRGELSYSKVRAMTRVATAENESLLLEVARHGTASQMEQLVRQYSRAKRLRSPDHARSQHEARSVSWFMDDDGMLVINARLAPAQGAGFIRSMEAMMALLDHSDQSGASGHQSGPPHEDRRGSSADVSAETFPQKRADALAQLSEQALYSLEREGLMPVSGGDRYQIMVHVEREDALLSGETASGHQASLDCGGAQVALSPQTARRLACDASQVTVLKGEDGTPLNIGRRTRTVPPAIRRALVIRDRGCRFPGCSEQRFVDAHHIHHWCDGGETSLDNLVLLCRRHHRLIHEEGYDLFHADTGDLVFRDRAGRVLPAAPFPQFPEAHCSQRDLISLEYEHQRLGLRIDENTARSRWTGERLDCHHAVWVMMAREDQHAAAREREKDVSAET